MASFDDAVRAAAPDPERAADLALFGQLVGTWDVVRRSRTRGGPWSESTRTWVFAWTLGGHAVADTQFDDAGTPLSLAVRTFDATAGIWRITFAGAQGAAASLIGGASGTSGIRTEGAISGGLPIRANFSEITPTSFVWDEWVADDADGPNWEQTIHVTASRV